MEYPTTIDIESKIKVILLTNQFDLAKLRDDIYEWATDQGINIFWVTSFVHSQKNEQGAWVYFENEIDAMVFKLVWW